MSGADPSRVAERSVEAEGRKERPRPRGAIPADRRRDVIRRIVMLAAGAASVVGVGATLAQSQTTGDALDPVRVAA